MSREQGEQLISTLLDLCRSIEHIRILERMPQNNPNVEQLVSTLISGSHLGNAHATYQHKVRELREIIQAQQSDLDTKMEALSSNSQIIANKVQEIAARDRELFETKQYISSWQAEAESLTLKSQELTQLNAILQQETDNKRHEKQTLVGHMAPRQVSFVLQKAMQDRNDEVLEAVKDRPLDPHFVNKQGESLFYTAATYNHPEVVAALLEHISFEFANAKDSGGCTAVFRISQWGYDNVITKTLDKFPALLNTLGPNGDTALHLALKCSLQPTAELILDRMSPEFASTKGSEDSTILHIAARSGLTELIPKILAKCPGLIHELDANGYTALHMAANEAVAELLIANMTPQATHAKGTDGCTILHTAAKGGNDTLAKWVVKKFPELINELDTSGNTAASAALRGNRQEIGSWLLERTDPALATVKDGEGFTLLHRAAQSGNDAQVTSTLDKFPQLLTVPGPNGETALHMAGAASCARVIVNKMSFDQANAKDNAGCTALHSAASKGRKDVATELLDRYPELINTLQSNGQTVFHAAFQRYAPEILDLLLSRTSEKLAYTPDDRGCNVLQWAAHTSVYPGYPEFTERVLAKFPALINVRATNGNTVLHYALYSAPWKLVEFLLTRMNPELILAKDADGYTALHLAARRNEQYMEGMDKIILKLIEHFPDLINELGPNRESVLHVARHDTFREIFLSKMSDEFVKARDNGGHTALHRAISQKNYGGMLKILVRCPELIEERDAHGNTFLHHAHDEKAVEIFLDKMPAELATAKNSSGETALHVLAKDGPHAAFLKVLAKYPDLLTERDANGLTLLHMSAAHGQLETTNLLLIKMSYELINARGNEGHSALHLAVGYHAQCVDAILNKMDPEVAKSKNNIGYTILHAAALKCWNASVVSMLLDRFPELINERDNNGWTVLHFASNKVVAEMILNKIDPALINVPNNQGQTALDLAKTRGFEFEVGGNDHGPAGGQDGVPLIEVPAAILEEHG